MWVDLTFYNFVTSDGAPINLLIGQMTEDKGPRRTAKLDRVEEPGPCSVAL